MKFKVNDTARIIDNPNNKSPWAGADVVITGAVDHTVEPYSRWFENDMYEFIILDTSAYPEYDDIVENRPKSALPWCGAATDNELEKI